MKKYINREMPREYYEVIQKINDAIEAQRRNVQRVINQAVPGHEDAEFCVIKQEEYLEGMLSIYHMLPTLFWMDDKKEHIEVTFEINDSPGV